MLRITVEVIPYGVESGKKTVLALTIFNDGTGTKEFGNYQYIATETVDDMVWDRFFQPHEKRTYSGEVIAFPRKRTAKELIKIVLNQMNRKEKQNV